MMLDVAISLKDVSKYYKLYDAPKYRLKEAFDLRGRIYHKKYYAINDLNLEIKRGEILGIVGKNGAGKSTLLKIITGVLVPDVGTAEVNGNISALLELGSGFNPEFTGIQNIFFYGAILGFSRKEMQEKMDDILEFADIGDFIHQPLKTYSSGMRARLGFAVAVNIDPDILILDEVLAVGDILFKRKCYAKMKEFFDGGKTILFVSHDVTSVKELCSRAVFLLDGGIALDGDPKTVTHYYEKYQFASEEARKSLKEEMLQLQNDTPGNNLADNNSQLQYTKPTESISETIDGDEYLSSFVSTPSFGKSNLATFNKIAIHNSNDEKVNVLQVDHAYKLSFEVKFNMKVDDIFFGAEFLTMKGNLVSGLDTKKYKTDKVYMIEKDDIYKIVIEFDCLLLPEVYLINIYVNNDNSGLTIHDAYIFKVKPATWFQPGLVHLRQKIEVKKLEK